MSCRCCWDVESPRDCARRIPQAQSHCAH
jgi:hypothetical protein